jgi:hypothetical protein
MQQTHGAVLLSAEFHLCMGCCSAAVDLLLRVGRGFLLRIIKVTYDRAVVL